MVVVLIHLFPNFFLAEREYALRSFKSGKTPFLIATNVASRGLDIPKINSVINFDMPNDIDEYVHRIGRTGRAGKAGIATSFISPTNKGIVRDLIEILNESGQEIPLWLEMMKSYGGGGRGRGGGGRRGDGYVFFFEFFIQCVCVCQTLKMIIYLFISLFLADLEVAIFVKGMEEEEEESQEEGEVEEEMIADLHHPQTLHGEEVEVVLLVVIHMVASMGAGMEVRMGGTMAVGVGVGVDLGINSKTPFPPICYLWFLSFYA